MQRPGSRPSKVLFRRLGEQFPIRKRTGCNTSPRHARTHARTLTTPPSPAELPPATLCNADSLGSRWGAPGARFRSWTPPTAEASTLHLDLRSLALARTSPCYQVAFLAPAVPVPPPPPRRRPTPCGPTPRTAAAPGPAPAPIIISRYYPKHLLFTSFLPPGIGEAACQSALRRQPPARGLSDARLSDRRQ